MKTTTQLRCAAAGFVLLLPFSGRAAFDTAAFVAPPVLGRPADRSITISIVPRKSLQIYYEFGTAPGAYPLRSDTATSAAYVPCRTSLTNLAPGTRYRYRLRYREGSAGAFLAGDEYTFVTQRARGSTFRFTIEADPHPYDKKGSHTLWPVTLQNQLHDSADFMLDLGDTFGDDHNPTTITSEDLRQLHLDDLPFFGSACHSLPLLFCVGNHEGESGYYLLQAPPNNLAVQGTLWRKYYYANPSPDGFYTGNAALEPFGIGAPENYYAWEWGDALFVVLDAYRYYTANAKPRGWDWTIGKDQYDWLRRTLEGSTARFKFVFAHHTLGETRGGAATAPLYEWGGYEADQTTWGFTANRPGWEMPIHRLMAAHGVTVYFQGHDHLFAVEQVGNIVYQEVPMPSDSTYTIGMTDNGNAYGGVKLGGSGHLRVTVDPAQVTVEYIQAWLPADENATRHNRQIAYTYTAAPATGIEEAPATLPRRMTLEQNYPNPFNPATTIQFQLPAPCRVTLRVFDQLGREVATLVDHPLETGTHRVLWDAAGIATGVYFYRLQANGAVESRQATVLK